MIDEIQFLDVMFTHSVRGVAPGPRAPGGPTTYPRQPAEFSTTAPSRPTVRYLLP